jgi:hypothetical protein
LVIVGVAGRHYLIMNARRLAPLAAPALLAAAALGPPPARAEAQVAAGAGGVPGLTYRAPAECPPEPAFVAAVGARGGRLDRPATGGSARAFDVSITHGGSAYRGSLQVLGSDGASGAREVHAASCAEVVDGLAVVTAIALRAEPEAATPPPPAPAAAAAPAPPQGNPPPEPDRLRIMKIRGVDTIQVNGSKIGVGRVLSYSFSAGADFGLVPGTVMPRYDFSVARANFITPPDGLHYVIGNIVRARVSWFGAGTTHVEDAVTEAHDYVGGTFTSVHGFSFGIDICHAPHYDLSGIVLMFCAEYGGGVAALDTKDALGGSLVNKTAGFASIGVSSELRFNVSRYFHLSLRGGGDLSFVPLAAELADGTRLWHATPFSGYAVGGLGFQL